MRVLFVIDPLPTLNLATETSLLLMEELARRGHRSCVALLGDLYLTERGAGATNRRIEVDMAAEPFYSLDEARDEPLSSFDLVLMRKDPPVDADYVAATFVLERAARDVPVINDPVALRTVNEKLLPLQFPEFAPPTLVGNDVSRMVAFAARHARVVLKPLHDCSGRGIRIVDGAAAEATIPAYLREQGGHFVLAQRFLDGVERGDKRIFLLAGEDIGAVNRLPAGRDRLANIHQGARVEATTVTSREREIIAALRPGLVARGLWLAGIDVIDGYLTEVNVTSPSAVRQINAVSGRRLEGTIVDFLERRAGLP